MPLFESYVVTSCRLGVCSMKMLANDNQRLTAGELIIYGKTCALSQNR